MPVSKVKCKSLFSSTTFWAIILLLVQAMGPKLETIFDNPPVKASDIIDLLTIVATCGLGIIDRINAGDLYTPKGVYGPDKPNC